MKFSATAAILPFVMLQGALAIEFDIRDFEGLWESNEIDIVRFDTPPIPGFVPPVPGQLVGVKSLGSIQCEATGDFRKVMCDFTLVQPGPTCPQGGAFRVKFILDQFDADTGKTKVLKGNGQCCDPATAACVDLPAVPGASPNFQLSLLPGKSNKHVRALSVTFGVPDLASPDDDEPFETIESTFQMRKTGGGFKSYD